jgi:hypothetical protein
MCRSDSQSFDLGIKECTDPTNISMNRVRGGFSMQNGDPEVLRNDGIFAVWKGENGLRER